MADRYGIRKDPTGYTVTDKLTGEPLILAMDPQTGLSEADALHLAELFNRSATQDDLALRP